MRRILLHDFQGSSLFATISLARRKTLEGISKWWKSIGSRAQAISRSRVQLNARCTTNGATSTTGLDDGTGPRLTDSAERDYFTLRERIETATKQIAGLQQYVSEQCLR
ncbi:lysis protein [Leclercia adecarboxylata]|nr:lysis protein [Leclercia adecarboxylata]